jgi:hypothetical protein
MTAKKEEIIKAEDDFGGLEALTKPRDLAWDNWAKFKEVGDEVAGYIRDVFYRPEETVGTNTMKAQRGLTLEQPDGTLVNVGIKYISFILAQTDNLRLGDPLKIVFSKTLPPTQKMYSPTKVFSFYGKNLPANAGNKTVKQLTDEDSSAGGTKAPVEPGTTDEGFDDFQDSKPPMEEMPPIK